MVAAIAALCASLAFATDSLYAVGFLPGVTASYGLIISNDDSGIVGEALVGG